MKNQLLYDLEDYVAQIQPDFEFVGDGDIERISSILGQSQYCNLIYVGPSGSGKTANLFGIVKRKAATIAGKTDKNTRLPLHMVDRRFLLLDTNTLFASNDPQLIETSIKSVFAELDKH